MVRPNFTKRKPYRPSAEVYNWQQPPVPTQDIQRPERPETPVPARRSALRFLTIRRHRVNRGLLHVHSNGLRSRMPGCPHNATCVGIDDIGEFMYNQASKCRHFMGHANRMINATQATFPESSLNNGFPATEQNDEEIKVEAEAPQEEVASQNSWDAPTASTPPM